MFDIDEWRNNSFTHITAIIEREFHWIISESNWIYSKKKLSLIGYFFQPLLWDIKGELKCLTPNETINFRMHSMKRELVASEKNNMKNVTIKINQIGSLKALEKGKIEEL